MPPRTKKNRPWKCPHCPKSYTQQSNLCTHEITKHPYLCAQRRAKKALANYSDVPQNIPTVANVLKEQLEQGLINEQEYIKQHLRTLNIKPVVIPTIQLDKILEEKIPWDNKMDKKFEAFSNTIKFIEDQLLLKNLSWQTITRMIIDATSAKDYSELIHMFYDNVISSLKGTGQISFLTRNNTIETRNLDTELAYKLYERIETAVTLKLCEKLVSHAENKVNNTKHGSDGEDFFDDWQLMNDQYLAVQELSKDRMAIKTFCYDFIQGEFDVILKAPEQPVEPVEVSEGELKNETFETVIPHGIRRNSLPTSDENKITITKSGETTPTISEGYTSPVTSPEPVAPPRSPKRQDSVSPVTVKITVAEGGRFFG